MGEAMRVLKRVVVFSNEASQVTCFSIKLTGFFSMQNWQCDCVVNLPHCDRQCHILRHLRSEQVPPFYFLDVFSLSRFCILNYLVHHACQPLFVMMLGIVIVLWCCGSIFSTTVVYKPTHKTTIINNLQDNICPTWHDLVVAVIAIANRLVYIFRCLYHAKYDEEILKRFRAQTWKPKTSSWINVIKAPKTFARRYAITSLKQQKF